MQTSVYDIYVQRPDGRRMHFDILVTATLTDIETIWGFGRIYLAAKGIPSAAFKAEKCSYCHTESAGPPVEAELARTGFAILELENCE